MDYLSLYHFLKSRYNNESDQIDFQFGSKQVLNFSFVSNYPFLPKQTHFFSGFPFEQEIELLQLQECFHASKAPFKYSVFLNEKSHPHEDVILLLHGLNEKNWDKYLPWAWQLCDLTQMPVVLFPLPFHMNRTPELWCHTKRMHAISRKRKALIYGLENSNFGNAAFSLWWHSCPECFLCFLDQSLSDLMQILTFIREGKHPLLTKNCRIHFLGFSLGATIIRLFSMMDAENYFEDSRYIMFCGGLPIDQMRLNSKYIFDSQAAGSIVSYVKQVIASQSIDEISLKYLQLLIPILSCQWKNGGVSYLKNLDRTMVCALKKDEVMPIEALRSYCEKQIPAAVFKPLDFLYNYNHAMPFSIQSSVRQQVDDSFKSLFKLFATHFFPSL